MSSDKSESGNGFLLDTAVQNWLLRCSSTGNSTVTGGAASASRTEKIVVNDSDSELFSRFKPCELCGSLGSLLKLVERRKGSSSSNSNLLDSDGHAATMTLSHTSISKSTELSNSDDIDSLSFPKSPFQSFSHESPSDCTSYGSRGLLDLSKPKTGVTNVKVSNRTTNSRVVVTVEPAPDPEKTRLGWGSVVDLSKGQKRREL